MKIRRILTSLALVLAFVAGGGLHKLLASPPPESPQFWAVGGQFNSTVGAPIASAATIAPDHREHHVTGTTAIVTITPPWNGFTGCLVLYSDAIWTWTAAGNIQVAGTVTTGNQVPVTFCFDGTKWIPSRIT